eukprot:2959570-Heterocapsa_arctica.AAC.1
MRDTNDFWPARQPAQQEAADEGDEREERQEVVGEPWRRRQRADGALHHRRAVQGLRTAAVQLRSEQVEDRRIGRRVGPQLNVVVARALGEAAGQDVRDGSRNDLRPPARKDTEHPRRARQRARGLSPNPTDGNMIMIS